MEHIMHNHSWNQAIRTPRCLHPLRALSAFTLIELLVVIAIVGLLIALLLPALSAAQRAGKRIVSLSNLHSNSQIIFIYANDHKDDLVNPFMPPKPGLCDEVREAFFPPELGVCNNSGISIAYRDSQTDLFGKDWFACVYYGPGAEQVMKSAYSPSDAALKSFIARKAATSGFSGRASATSYWYPPVFWQDAARFAGQTLPPINTGTDRNKFRVRRNKVADMTTPALKVLLFEGKEYEHPKQPMWYMQGSRPLAAIADGSAARMVMNDIIARTAAPASVPVNGQILSPSGKWDYPDAIIGSSTMEYGLNDGFTWTTQKQESTAYFWFTRNGIRGRDF